MVSNGVFYIRAGKDSVELYDLLGDTAQSTSLHRDPARSADLARFKQVSDSLDGLYRQTRTSQGLEEEEEP
jgi:hypothetical protein